MFLLIELSLNSDYLQLIIMRDFYYWIAVRHPGYESNNHRKEVFYDIKDKVWWLTKNIRADQPSRKQDHQIIDAFESLKRKILKHNYSLLNQ